jgi:hypothetical protein
VEHDKWRCDIAATFKTKLTHTSVRVNGEMQEGEDQLCDAAFINSQ